VVWIKSCNFTANFDNLKFTKVHIILICALFLCIVSCRKAEQYPIEPCITYNGLTYQTDSDGAFNGNVIVSIGYTDGNGDLGLDDGDTIPPFNANGEYYYNMLVAYQRYENGTFVEKPLLSWNNETQSYDTISFNARFRRLLDGDIEKPISGVIDYTMMVKNPFSPNDTIRFAISIIDRALNVSNTITTGPIYTGLTQISQQ